jgi:hypothetical protein
LSAIPVLEPGRQGHRVAFDAATMAQAAPLRLIAADHWAAI